MTTSYNVSTATDEQIVGETESGQPIVAEVGDGSLPSGEGIKDSGNPDNRHAAKGPHRTSFHAEEAADSKLFRRLWKHQNGYHSDDTGKRARKDKVRIAESLCDSLHLQDYIKRDVKRLVKQCDGRKFNKIGGIEAIALGCIGVAENRTIETTDDFENRIQVRRIENYSGDRLYGHDCSMFKHLADKHGVNWRKAVRKVKEET